MPGPPNPRTRRPNARRGAQPHAVVGRHRRRPAPRRLDTEAQRLTERAVQPSAQLAPLSAPSSTEEGDTAIRVGDHHSRFAAMRVVFERFCPDTGERMKTVMDGDRLACTMGFVGGGLHHGGIRPPRRRAPRRNGRESRKPHRSGDRTLIHYLPPSTSPALSLSKLHIATHVE